MPKKHKNPTGSRFITSCTNTINSNLSQLVGNALSTMLKTVKNTSTYVHKYKSYKNYFIVDNRNEVLQYIKDHNHEERRYRKSVKSFDFSNLYTSIPLNKLITSVSKFINKVFLIKQKTFITLTNKNAYFANRRSKSTNSISLTSNELINHIEFIINNNMVIYKGKIYKQLIGIPMGTNCAPHLANIFLHIYEEEFIESCLEEGKIDVIEKLQGMFRYQDDCIVFDDEGIFELHMEDIYPPELSLNKTNTSVDTCNYLDLTISVYRHNFNYRSYDKRRDYNFEIVNYPDLGGNIPFKPSYGVFTSQLVRFCHINKTVKYFTKDVKDLISKLYKQNYDLSFLKDKYVEFTKHKINVWSKYGIDISDNIFIKELFKLKS